MFSSLISIGAILLTLFCLSQAQTYQRLGACPTFGCVFPPDQYAFLYCMYSTNGVELLTNFVGLTSYLVNTLTLDLRFTHLSMGVKQLAIPFRM
jgi:hypothetical protein